METPKDEELEKFRELELIVNGKGETLNESYTSERNCRPKPQVDTAARDKGSC